ncbi:MAG: ATP synthase F1 subunit epsilon [Erysipelothrix sp.]|jgi:F-type H+-transporting ATPase subunit epsilon|nr:ATP synthase F1 subunit epsilon [Erysipelothrix sp.]
MFQVKIVTPKGLYKVMNTTILNVETTQGQLGILKNHMPIVAILTISLMRTRENGEEQRYAIAGGTLYFQNNVATLLVEAIEHSEEIDVQRALQAKEHAEKLMLHKEEVDMLRAEIALKKAVNRIKAAS